MVMGLDGIPVEVVSSEPRLSSRQADEMLPVTESSAGEGRHGGDFVHRDSCL